MMRRRNPSSQTLAVLTALSKAPTEWRYGYELGAEVGLQSGSLYPILVRLSDRRLLESRWELDPPTGRPPRHLYRLTTHGLEYAAQHTVSPPATTRKARRPELRGAS
jgi:DNA-binding PadR family transcriptional regulator